MPDGWPEDAVEVVYPARMCGRFANSEPLQITAMRWKAAMGGDVEWVTSDDIRPTQRVPVLLAGPLDRPRRLGLMHWGWVRDFAASGGLINARAEEMAGKRTFAEAVQRRRCLVPATSWFEWLAQPSVSRSAKIRFRLKPVVDEPWAMAGLWESVACDGVSTGRVVVVTTRAHPSIAQVHERMPGIIGEADATAWLRGDAAAALRLLTPCESRAEQA